MNRLFNRIVTTVCAAGTATMLTVTPSFAGGDTRTPPPTGGKHPVIVEDTGFYPGNFDDVGSVQQTRECGALISITVVQDEIRVRDITYANGDVESRFKGPFKLMFSNNKNNITVTLDNSGPYTQVTYARPAGAVYFNLSAPGAIYAFNAAEDAAFKAKGLPPIFYYSKGKLEEYEPTETKAFLLSTPNKVTSVCKLLGLPDKFGSGLVDAP